MNIQKLEQILKIQNQPKFRLDQIIKVVYQDGVSSFLEISNLPRELRETLNKEIKILSFEVEKVLVSSEKDSMKALLKLEDGKKIETVLISPKPGLWSACISCQVGCPMNCAFCATGSGGFKRNLTGEEIADQVLFWKQYLIRSAKGGAPSPYKGEGNSVRVSSSGLACREYATSSPVYRRGARLTNIIYMGMGEPFLNWEEVKNSLKILTDKKYLNFGSRSISISTVGVPGGISKLAADFPQINLAVSLHFTDNKTRTWHMPGNIIYDLEKLKNDLEKYLVKTNRKVFLEYILFSDINDGEESAKSLVKYLKSFKKSYLLHINLIRFNETSKKFKHSPYDQTQKFKNYLEKQGINVTIRKSLGTDVQGACGQLAGE